jgi:hypothetical protein
VNAASGGGIYTLTDIPEISRSWISTRTPSLTDWEPSNWEGQIRERLEKLSTLETGWDGYGAGPIRRDVLIYAAALLYTIMSKNAPAPHITPMSHEGVMLEWHESGIDLEIEIKAPGDVWVSFVDSARGIDREWPLKANFDSLSEPVYNLTRRSVPHRAS